MEYNFREIEKKWQQKWVDNKTYKVVEDESKQKFYVLNMFPYPSGAGLHVGHPLGYIASDIYARYKRLQGFNVLNPMGYDAYGLPAEQYAIQTGQHPAVTTAANIARYREQLDKIGFSFDWDREVRTCEPGYYHWTQWAFQKMFNSFYCNSCQKAQPISKLVAHFEASGTEGLDVACSEELHFTAEEWKSKSEKEQQEILMNYRIAYLGETMVNWCPALGTVLANDEVVDGVSERGGHPVVQKKMRQWCLRVSAYAQRLLDGLETVDWTDSLKETQRNWIGRSEGTEVRFKVKDSDLEFTIFTTRADTMFGVTFMVLAPESELVPQLTTDAQRAEVEAYLERTKKRTERERISDRRVTGVFSGSYAVNPFTGESVPVWISDYVLEKGWKFTREDNKGFSQSQWDDKKWQNVTVPHDWAIYGPFSIENDKQHTAIAQDGQTAAMEHAGRTGGLPFVGVGWYRTTFSTPQMTKGGKCILLFDGAMSHARVYVNGKEAGYWPYGYNAFQIDATPYLNADGKNVLAVRLENETESSRWYPGAGLYRNVRVIVTGDAYVPVWGTLIFTRWIFCFYRMKRLFSPDVAA
jgi:leucyl-tRNA synthetase